MSSTVAVQAQTDVGIPGLLPPCGLEKVSMGTTIMALKYAGGVVMASDSRTSTGIVTNKAAQKITPISDRIFMARCGVASDSQFVAQLVKNYIFQHQVELNGRSAKQFAPPTVKSAAALAKLITYNNKDYLSLALIVAGYDHVKGPQVYSITSGGAVFERNIALSGSGSTYILGLADNLYKPDMSRTEALELAKTLVHHAMSRDGASGGMIRWVLVDKDGVEEGCLTGDKITPLELLTAHH